jgi:transcriptional regulator GlxA family with amidase domain
MHDFTILILNQAFASNVALSVDILSTAALMAKQLGMAQPRWRVVSEKGGLIALSNGLQLATEKLPHRVHNDKSVWIIPGMGVNGLNSAVDRMLEADALWAAKALNRHLRLGGKVAAGCSSVLLLQAAGVLAGKTVTISWWLASYLRSTQPDCTVKAQRMVVVDGNVITAGAALAHSDLMLYLLRMHCSAALAEVVSRVLLIDSRLAQAQYVIPSVLASGNALVTQLSASIEAALPKVLSMRDLAQQMCMSERTLARHVVAATGLPPLALVQHVRLARARALLEKSRLSVEQVAEKVGYADATALRRMMKKSMDATPRQLRSAVTV